MKRTNLVLSACLIMAATALTSCQKDVITNPFVASSQDDDQVTALYDDVLNEADDITLSDGVSKAPAAFEVITGSGTRTIVTTFEGNWTFKTVTFVNFINGKSENGHVKNGVIVIKVLGRPTLAQFERVITFNNFTIDDNKIEGEKHITKTADYTYSVTLTGGKVTFADGTTYTRNFTRVRTWETGYLTPANIFDDVYSISGSSTGVNRKGIAYTHTITNDLVIKVACRWIVEGSVNMVVGEKTILLDYGTGECDNIATITVDGKTTEIKLRRGNM